jgi:hypothetical protein
VEGKKMQRLKRMPLPLSEADKRWLRDYHMGYMIPVLEASGTAAQLEGQDAPIADLTETGGEPLISEKQEKPKGTDLAALKLKELQAKAEEKGLPTYGKKADLIERLQSHDDSE